MPKLLVNSFRTRSSLQIKYGNSRVDKDIRPQSKVTATQSRQVILSSINWLLGFFHTLASLASTTWLHGNYEWQWHLLNPFPVAQRQYYRSSSSTAVINVNTTSVSRKDVGDYHSLTGKDQLDDYLPCRQCKGARKDHEMVPKSSILESENLIRPTSVILKVS
ncbi:hypothetical protein EV44_g4685 [Erysiphe necator]|uniref:Uncharacterized protein n=1 Tax=Uncinula necator TaxID=52586 RepID=A0A0B1P6Y4_UNCNE|nr:hypothetical protein EV44_g4685 [Erysiphe necator]